MLHGNDISTMAVEAHVGASLLSLGGDLQMQLPNVGDASLNRDGIEICVEIKTRTGLYSRIPTVDSSELLQGDLDHFITVREKRAPLSQDEVCEYAQELLDEYRRALNNLSHNGSNGDLHKRHWHLVEDGRYIDHLSIFTDTYALRDGRILYTISGDFNTPPEDEIRCWINEKVSEANGQMQPRDPHRVNVIAVMLPASDLALPIIEDDLVEFMNRPSSCPDVDADNDDTPAEILEPSVQWPNVDAIIVGEFHSTKDNPPAIGYRCRSFKISDSTLIGGDLLAQIQEAIQR
jgi:hypothetical protein